MSKYIHLIGIGGIGMSGIAIILHNKGFIITGSDNNNNSEHIFELIKLGIKIKIGHDSENIDKNCEAIVYSTAINNDNPEIIKGKELKIPIYHRSEMLNILIKDKKSIAITGQAGKTTTTALITCLLENSNFEPSFIVGGIINEYNTQSLIKDTNWIVIEVDESDCSFVNIKPSIAVITNIYEPDLYTDIISMEKLINSFKQFIENLPKDGLLIINGDNDNINSLMKKINDVKSITYGINNDCTIQAKNIRYSQNGIIFDIDNKYLNSKLSKNILDIYLPMYGIHNVYNALTLFILANELNISEKNIRKTLSNYQGVKHRFTKIPCDNQINIIDDLAQTSIKLKALVDGVKQFKPYSKIFIINNNIRFNRLILECSKVFKQIDYIFLLNKTDNNEITTFEFKNELKIYNILEKSELVKLINQLIKPNDIIIYNMSKLNLEWNDFCLNELKYLVKPLNITI